MNVASYLSSNDPDAPFFYEEQDPASQASAVNWYALVDQLKAGETSAMEELYRIFFKGVRLYLCRQLGPQDLDDKVHDAFLIVVQAIQRDELREPDRLMGFVRTIVRRQVATHIEYIVHRRRDQIDVESGVPLVDRRRNPEERAIGGETLDLMVGILRGMSDRDREILTRFYIHEQSQEQICEEMDLSETQFRLLKSRAKARFGQAGRRKTQRKDMAKNFLRKIASAWH